MLLGRSSSAATEGEHLLSAQDRAQAIRVLMKHFPWLLNADSEWQRQGYDAPFAYWWHRIHELESKSSLDLPQGVCRARETGGCVGCGVLPSPDCDKLNGAASCLDAQERRRAYYEDAGPHGSRLFWLACDFLCARCSSSFLELTPQLLASQGPVALASWRRALCLRGPETGDLDQVTLELQRAQARQQLMHFARLRDFDAFQKQVGDPLFDRAAAEANILSRCRRAAPHAHMHILPSVHARAAESISIGLASRSGRTQAPGSVQLFRF